MPNYCWNWIEISASKENIEKIRTVIDQVNETEEGFWASNYPLLIEKPAISKEDLEKMQFFDVYSEWGSKWFTPYVDGYHLSENPVQKNKNSYITIAGDSAWGPMLPLCEKLSKHYNADITIEFEEPGCDFGGRYRFSNGNIQEQEEYAYLEWQYINGNFEQIESHLEDSICDYDTFFALYCDYKKIFQMMEPEERKIIYEMFKKEKDAEI